MRRFSNPTADSSAETKIESGLVLRVYQKIVDQGERQGATHILGSLTASSDYDGYGITLSDGTVSARVLFHNRVQVDTPNRKALETFRQRLLRASS